MAGKPETPRDAIVARLDGRTMSWLAREMSKRSGASFGASRSNLYRWLKGDVAPTARYAVLLADVLGGDAEDFGLGTRSRPNRVSRSEFDALAERLAAVERSVADLARVQRRVSEEELNEEMAELLERAQKLAIGQGVPAS